jgi:hypothetical protein
MSWTKSGREIEWELPHPYSAKKAIEKVGIWDVEAAGFSYQLRL